MTTKYAVFNPLDGSNTLVETKEELILSVAQHAIMFYLAHSNQAEYTEVTIDQNNWETWTPAKFSIAEDVLELIKQKIALNVT